MKFKGKFPFKALAICSIPILLLTILSAWRENPEVKKNSNDGENEAEGEKIVLNINSDITYQTIDNFGASDAWSTQFVGNWPSEKKNAIADLLFSKDLDQQGNPKGIGLSLWRYNLGGGSKAQGAESGIGDPWRRGESFIEPNKTREYNWNKMTGQAWFAHAAKTRGVEDLLLFTNTPPVTMTRNGKAYASKPDQSNLSSEKYGEFATYLADVVEGLQQKGLQVDYLSPVNEPQWDWTNANQEGTPFWNNEIAGIIKALDRELTQRNIQAKIDVPEAGQINYLYEEGNKPGRSTQIEDFFNKTSENYIGNLENVSKAISGHSYFTTSPYPNMLNHRKELNAAIQNIPDLKYWMSEYCILGKNDGEIRGKGRDLGIDPALYVARVINTDLTIAQASAWHWWLAISPYDYKDGLVYIDKKKEDGNFYESKMLWALGNYSSFIRPGYERIKINSPASDEDVLFSAYKNPENGEKVIVIVNSKNKELSIQVKEEDTHLDILSSYVTSSDRDLEKTSIASGNLITIPEKSITTLICK
ncbi:glycoside hydrolase [Gramella sp. AN32]|uniref:Glycoside hydrolase n=1 Tax=Christiangramia antarctica TaxID=2058158 RepID=A0ABW5X618_9FLAO|nr:glycoside hydrolase [Gramella sp. AN32]MCM4155786.1 xylanase [Gramella sp. AN32]